MQAAVRLIELNLARWHHFGCDVLYRGHRKAMELWLPYLNKDDSFFFKFRDKMKKKDRLLDASCINTLALI